MTEKRDIREWLGARLYESGVNRFEVEEGDSIWPPIQVVVKKGKRPAIFRANRLSLSKLEFTPDLVDGLGPRGTVSVWAAPGGTGKSTLAVAAAAAVAAGKGLGGLRPRGKLRVLFVSVETAVRDLGMDFAAASEAQGMTPAERKQVEDGVLVYGSDSGGRWVFDEAGEKALRDFLVGSPADLLVVDPFANVSAVENENDNAEVGGVVARLAALAADHHLHALLIHHVRKVDADTDWAGDASWVRGGTAIVNIPRAVYTLSNLPADQRARMAGGSAIRVLTTAKVNRQPKAQHYFRMEVVQLPARNIETGMMEVRPVAAMVPVSAPTAQAVDLIELVRLVGRGAVRPGAAPVPYNPRPQAGGVNAWVHAVRELGLPQQLAPALLDQLLDLDLVEEITKSNNVRQLATSPFGKWLIRP